MVGRLILMVLSGIGVPVHFKEPVTVTAQPLISPQIPPTPYISSPVDEYRSSVTEVITCEPMFVALLIGRRGWTVKHIQDESGARVDIDQTVTPRKITVSGDEKSVSLEKRMVKDVLSYPHAQLHYVGKDDEDQRSEHSEINLNIGEVGISPQNRIYSDDDRSLQNSMIRQCLDDFSEPSDNISQTSSQQFNLRFSAPLLIENYERNVVKPTSKRSRFLIIN